MRTILLALAVTVLASDVQALVACKTRSSAVVVREACKRREVPLDLAALGAQGPAGTPGATGPAGRAAAYLADANGVEVGPLVFAEDQLFGPTPSVMVLAATIRHAMVGGGAVVQVDLLGELAGAVRYVSADCTGTPLIEAKTMARMLVGVKETVFHPVASSPEVTVASSEIGDQSGGCTSVTARGGCCIASTPFPLATLAVAETTTLSALGLAAPFHVTAP